MGESNENPKSMREADCDRKLCHMDYYINL